MEETKCSGCNGTGVQKTNCGCSIPCPLCSGGVKDDETPKLSTVIQEKFNVGESFKIIME